MSAGNDDGSSLIAIGLGTLIPTVVGAGIGMMVALATWTPSPDNGFSTPFAGICIGAITGFAVSWFMSWHASVVGILPDRPSSAMIWGVVPGLIFGASLGPVFAGITALFFDQLVSALFFGLFFGPLAGVIGWEIGYFVANFLHRGHKSPAH